ncbi:HsdM-like protein [Comamonas sp. 26]|nr:HsdM-like protein [Comamonas sp. 26]
MNHQVLSSFIWSVADLLRGDYKQSEYGRVIPPFTVSMYWSVTLL